MSRAIIEETTSLASEAAVEVCWRQWSALGALANPVDQRRAAAIVDPEALLIVSTQAARQERRLLDFVAWWAETGSELTSVQRFRTLAGDFPAEVGPPALETFAGLAADAGDRRWKHHRGEEATPRARTDKGPEKPEFVEPPTLWVRLRAGLGVGAKADILTYLLGRRGTLVQASAISEAVGYSSTTVRTAAGEMARARLIRKVSGHPTEYYAPPRPWVELLELYPPSSDFPSDRMPDPPPWRPWAGLFALLAAVNVWAENVREEELGGRVVASRARDLLENHQAAIAEAGIQVPATARKHGAEFLSGFRDTLQRVARWMRKAV